MQNPSAFKLNEQDSKRTSRSLPCQSAQVVVVGAGLAGLAAAQRLFESGFRDLIVLDALDRTGGRINSVKHGDHLFELGAQWLHGADENPLYQWLMGENMLEDFEDATAGFQGIFCTIDGREVPRSLVEKVLKIVTDSKLALSKNHYSDFLDAKKFKNAAEVFKHFLEVEIEVDDDLKANRKIVYSIFNWFLRYETIENSCESMEQVSINSYTDWNDHGDGTLINFKNGYGGLLDWFVSRLPSNDCIHLNKQVLNVEMLRSGSGGWFDESGNYYGKPIVIKYAETGANDGEHKLGNTIVCDHVIVTVSLGFLKKNHESFFTPKLPEIKRQLISSLGFGTVNKIILQFELPFWLPSNGIKLVWDLEDEGLREFPVWVKDVISFDVVRKQPNLLMGWIGGNGAKLIEQISSTEVGEICIRLLHKILPQSHRRPSKLVACLCSNWSSNPFICGSYSYQSMESFDLNIDKIQEPLFNVPTTSGLLGTSSTNRVPRLLFAGEATAGQLYSTAHGAIISGWREADRLRDHLSSGNKSNVSQLQISRAIKI